ncbi:MAG TPA: ATP synthase F1 subunit delta [Candidatus Acidoferrales bacterium]|nr:ATP synthase F1 subunit delta [Candidatus Acidoferrales bacterium]
MKAIAGRYAAAMFEAALAHGAAEQVRGTLESLGAVISESNDLRLFLANPGVPMTARLAVMEKLLDRLDTAPAARPLLRNFLKVLVDHRRTSLLPEIASEYVAKLNRHLGVSEVEVTSAVSLEQEKRTRLEQALAQSTQHKIAAQYDVDPALVGGAVVRIGSTIYDGSVSEQLRRLEQSLISE